MTEPTYAQLVARNVKAQAIVAGVTEAELAAALGLSPGAGNMNKRLNGAREFSLSEIETLAPLLNSTPSELTTTTK